MYHQGSCISTGHVGGWTNDDRTIFKSLHLGWGGIRKLTGSNCHRWGWFWQSLSNKLDLTPFCDLRVSTDTAWLPPSVLHCAHGTTVYLLPTVYLNSINRMATVCGRTPWMRLTTYSLLRMRLVSLCCYQLEFNSHFELFIRQSGTWRQ
jgi:hypothetical protein